MTISDVRTALFGWYEENEAFCLEKDFFKLMLITDGTEGEKKAAILAGLEDFENASLIKSSKYEDITYYFLVKPFSALEQSVSLNAQSVLAVSTCINEFCEVIEDKRDWCDPMNITEKDVYNLTNIISIQRARLTKADDLS